MSFQRNGCPSSRAISNICLPPGCQGRPVTPLKLLQALVSCLSSLLPRREAGGFVSE